MFPDSTIASKMELGKDKLKYVVNYGIAPFFAEGLKKQVDESEWHAVSYDESLNKVIQESEMDLVLRFWDTCNNKVQVRCWDSMFLGHATAADLLKNINDALSGFDLSKQVQLSMDGPSVNWKVLSDMKKEREEAGLNHLVTIGSCDLHVVHGALKSATEATMWNLKATMKGSFEIFKDSSARREDFISITGSTIFPLQFCPTRFECFSSTVYALISSYIHKLGFQNLFHTRWTFTLKPLFCNYAGHSFCFDLSSNSFFVTLTSSS